MLSAAKLVPAGVSVCFLADRGFADVQLMRYHRDPGTSAFASKTARGFIVQALAGNN